MSNVRLLARMALVLVFTTGTWEDILPGLDQQGEIFRSDALERPSDTEDEADAGHILSQLPPEPVLIAEAGFAEQVSVGHRLLPHSVPDARLPLVLSRILHVPIPADLA